jgi:hypothetical protein
MVAAACAPAPSAPTSDEVLLRLTVDAVWPAGSIPQGSNVTWQIGDAPGDDVGYTFGWLGGYVVVIEGRYAGSNQLIGHEGGHVVCATLWGDWSEECADANNPVAP